MSVTHYCQTTRQLYRLPFLAQNVMRPKTAERVGLDAVMMIESGIRRRTDIVKVLAD